MIRKSYFLSWLVAAAFLLAPISLIGQDVQTEATKLLQQQIATLQQQLTEKSEASSDDPHHATGNVSQHLQDVSVTIVSPSQDYKGGGEGSGVVITRKFPNGESVNFVWTAAHVVDNLRSTKTVIDSKTGTQKTVVSFADAKIVKSLTEDGRDVGKMELFAEVIRYNADEDLALLRIRKKNFVDASVSFYLEEEIPPIGTQLLHVGSLHGQFGSNSMTTGIMSQHGRIIDKRVFDQTTVAAFPGSSGGGVYLTDGKMMGMLVRGAGETFNLIVPVRRMQQWASHADVSWALDHSIPMITEEELEKLPVEDNGVEFSYSVKRADSAGEESSTIGSGPPHLGTMELERRYPVMMIWNQGELNIPPKK